MGCDIVVIGASAGGVNALKRIASSLPVDLKASVFIVLHTPPYGPALMAEILGSAGKVPVCYPKNGQKIERGNLYVAPPDSHLLVGDGSISVVRGPKENLHRPAIDPLFRSAAVHYGSRVAGVILSGFLDDGTAGLKAVKACGGISIVQTDAEVPVMTDSALRHVSVDYPVPLKEIAPLIETLANAPNRRKKVPSIRKVIQVEAEIAAMERLGVEETSKLGKTSTYTCPECSGTLWQIEDGALVRFRCHTGHAYTAESLSWDQAETVDKALWTALKTLEESGALASQMAARAKKEDRDFDARIFEDRAKKASERATSLRLVLTKNRQGPPIP